MTMPQCLVEATHTPYAAIHVMMEDIAYALKTAGVGVTHYLFHPEMQTDLYTLLLKELAAFDAPRILFDINGKTNPAQRATHDGGHLLDHLGIRQITFLVDNPMQHVENLKKGSENGILLYLDRDFAPLLDSLDLPYETRLFFPHGGPDILAKAPPLPDRPMDLLYVGNIFCPPAFPDWLAANGIGDEMMAGALDRAAERVLMQSDPIHDALLGELTECGFELALAQRAALNTALEHFVNGKYRWEMIHNLQEANLTVCGDIHAGAHLPSDKIQVLGPTLFRTFLDLTAQSKFLLNPVPVYRNGAHERVFYGMNRGTVILNSHSRYLEPEAEQGLGVAMIPNDFRNLGEWYQDQLAAIPAFEDRREDTLGHFLDHHSWSKRLEPVLAAAGLTD
ncbi:hypothetical protein [Aestuariispira insulae]|uniref:Glycosyl transferase family 1 n=1 Tax=Aestuariispira insulae TaxID=1461337 RepID=A0A3D9H9H0_9PROT|nr:hypothetical protein [Aestuariispira insulae]RED46140.1 hypothetical protein DFP90_11049 [Aestuariispira insulae]